MTTAAEITKAMSQRERVLKALQTYGQQEIFASLDDIAAKTGKVGIGPSLDSRQVYFSLYRLAAANQVEIMTESVANTGRKKFSGVKILKAPTVENMTSKAAEKVRINKTEKTAEQMKQKYPQILKYATQKLAVERARQIIIEEGLSGDSVQFTPNPMGEEALQILGEFIECVSARIQLETDLAAANSNIDFLKSQRHLPTS